MPLLLVRWAVNLFKKLRSRLTGSLFAGTDHATIEHYKEMTRSSGSRSEDEANLYEVVAYSETTFTDLLYGDSRKMLAKVGEQERKRRIRYFIRYFRDLSAQTIIREKEYIDHDFFDDFSAYYVSCFRPYGRLCSRLHFFNLPFTSDEFCSLLGGETSPITPDKLQDHYLGFIVVKPLPVAVVGKTCLRTYSDDPVRRHFPISRTYEAHLFGPTLTVDTLAFQQQDSVVAACASSALWAVFQGTGKLFHHRIPSPVEITRLALANPQSEARTLPNKGLYPAEIACAIRGVGLEPFPIEAKDEYNFKGNLYSYLKGRIPLLMAVSLEGVLNDEALHYDLGHHAVAVTGYSLGKAAPVPHPETGFLLKATRIDKIYAHDDQIGPHARMKFYGDSKDVISYDNKSFSRPYLDTSWLGPRSNTKFVRAEPLLLLVPLYHKIRISFDDIWSLAVVFDDFIEKKHVRDLAALMDRLQWDIFLTTIVDLKSEILESEQLTASARVGGPAYRREVLLESMPRYIWRAVAEHGGQMVLELLFDATDIEQGPLFLRAIEYHDGLSTVIRTQAKEPNVEAGLSSESVWRILGWFRDQPLP
ncbi:MAG: hypothetical protein ACLP5H_31525 [Desulfomonilaceae bacterium]